MVERLHSVEREVETRDGRVYLMQVVPYRTVEERIDQMITSKKALAGMVIDDGEGWLTELSTESLREVFALGAEAESDE